MLLQKKYLSLGDHGWSLESQETRIPSPERGGLLPILVLVCQGRTAQLKEKIVILFQGCRIVKSTRVALVTVWTDVSSSGPSVSLPVFFVRFWGLLTLFLSHQSTSRGQEKQVQQRRSQLGERSLLCFIMGKFAQLLSRSRKGPLCIKSPSHTFFRRESLCTN